MTVSVNIQAAVQETEPSPLAFELQTVQEFKEDFVNAVSSATTADQIAFQTMQFEICDETQPIVDALVSAKMRGVEYVSFRYDRVAREHIRDPEGQGQAWFRPDTLGGLAIYAADGDAKKRLGTTLGTSLRGEPLKGETIKRLSSAFRAREDAITILEELGITDPAYKERGSYKRGSHDHIKMAIVGDTAWLGTANQRAVDYEWSNFMIKVSDPEVVSALKDIYGKDQNPGLNADEVLLENRPDVRLFFDAGNKGESVIYQQALTMIASLQSGDSITMIGQWPPVNSMYGDLAKQFMSKMSAGIEGKFLLSPEDHLHPNAFAARVFKGKMDKKVTQNPNMSAVYLARPG